MKKIFLFLAAGLVVLTIVAVVFILTFNVDRLRPAASQAVEKALGKPVEMGRLSLGFRGGLAVGVDGFSIYPDAEKKLPPALKLESASVALRLLPLLRRQVEIGSVVVSGLQAEVKKGADGSLTVAGISPSAKKEGAPAGGTSSSSGLPLPLSIDSILIERSEVIFRDESVSPAREIPIRAIALSVRRFSLTHLFSFDLKASVFSSTQNVRVSGQARLAQPQALGYVENFLLKTNLADWDLEALEKNFPAFSTAGMKENPAGTLEVQLDRVTFGPSGLSGIRGNAAFSNGKVAFTRLQHPIEAINLSADFTGDQVRVSRFGARLADGVLEGTANIQRVFSDPSLAIKLSANDLSLDQFAANASPSAPRLSGRLSLNLDATARGISWEAISRTLTGRGRLSLKEGVILNYNLLGEIMRKLSAIPGVAQAVQSRFPGAYQAALLEKSTVLQPVDWPLGIENGRFHIEPLFLAAPGVALSGVGDVGLDRSIVATGIVRLHRDLTYLLMQSVLVIQTIVNSQGELEIPLRMEGVLPSVRIVPDTQYIASRILSGTAQEAVTEIVRDPQEGLKKTFKSLLGTASAPTTS